MISFETSMNMLELLDGVALRSEQLFLDDALGRVLAEDIVAEANDPAVPMAAMDGYAVVHSDLAHGRIAIIGDNPAGNPEAVAVEPGLCIKTFTGAMMPEGADTLIPIENVTVEGEQIVIDESVPEGFSVRPVGESYRRGEVLIRKGAVLGFAEIGVLAGLNRVTVPVVLRPRVAVLATGSEILEVGETATSPSQIRSSNHHTIAAIARLCGAQTVQMGTVKDDREAITEAYTNALASADIVISTGGVSVGDYDFVKEIVPRLGAEVIYHGVKIKPGQHLLLARREGKFILALPGFAYSSAVTALLYAVPLIRKFLGRHEGLPVVEATLKEPFRKRSKKSEFTACNLSLVEGRYMVDFEGKRTGSSAILNNMLGGAALMITGEEDGDLDAGMAVNVIPLDRL
jgi:molybdopterin molybdotransferase